MGLFASDTRANLVIKSDVSDNDICHSGCFVVVLELTSGSSRAEQDHQQWQRQPPSRLALIMALFRRFLHADDWFV